MTFGPNDKSRISALEGYGILDSPNEAEFDEIVREAARVLRTPIALISLVDENRQWFKAKVGLEPVETPRSISFCTHAIRGPDVFVVEDATKDARFAANPLVTGDPSIRFYAGAPLKTAGGMRIGTICVIDSKVHPALTDHQKSELKMLAERTVKLMEARKARNAAKAATTESRQTPLARERNGDRPPDPLDPGQISSAQPSRPFGSKGAVGM